MLTVSDLESIASTLQLLLYVSIILVITGSVVYLKWKRKGVSVLIFCFACLILLVPISACFFLSTFTPSSMEYSIPPTCDESFCKKFCNAASNTDALTSSETQAFLLLLSGTVLFGFSNEKNRKKFLIIGAILLFAGFVLLLFSAYLLNNGSGIACSRMLPCYDCSCSKYI